MTRAYANLNYARVAFDIATHSELLRYMYGVVIKMSLVINETITCATKYSFSLSLSRCIFFVFLTPYFEVSDSKDISGD